MSFATFDFDSLMQNEIESHKLQGYYYVKQSIPQFKEMWKDQLYRNHCIKSELINLGVLLKETNFEVCLLKGFSLLGDVYLNWGERFASDVDWFVKASDYLKIKELLILNHYIEVKEKKWVGNDFKTLFYKKYKNLEITLELHTRLFWHVEQRDLKTRDSLEFLNYKVLDLEEQLLHLCGHLGFQHNFLKLFWLLDIKLFIEKYNHQIKWDQFWKLAQKDHLLLSSYFCLSLVDNNNKNWRGEDLIMKHNISSLRIKILKLLIRSKFLVYPKQKPLSYFIIKNALKDRLFDDLKYWNFWIINKLKT